eukprot:ANDGO_07338.mRNA.1 hypothetical protein
MFTQRLLDLGRGRVLFVFATLCAVFGWWALSAATKDAGVLSQDSRIPSSLTDRPNDGILENQTCDQMYVELLKRISQLSSDVMALSKADVSNQLEDIAVQVKTLISQSAGTRGDPQSLNYTLLKELTNLQEKHETAVGRLKRITDRFWRIEDFLDRRLPKDKILLDHRKYWAPLPSIEKWKTLPRLAVVNAVTPVWLAGYEWEETSLKCYLAYHGYPYYPENVELQPDRFLSSGRLRGMQKYLPYFQWIIHVSADTAVANRSKRIEPYLDDDFDVILTRRNFYLYSNPTRMIDGKFAHYPQVNTELVMVKNSAGGRKFVDEFLSMSDGGKVGMVWDMGELHQILLKILFPDHYEECAKVHIDYLAGNYKEVPGEHPLDVFSQSVRNSPCASLFTNSEWRDGPIKIKILDLGIMNRDQSCGQMKLLRCQDFFIHTKCAGNFQPSEEVYCLPVKEYGVSTPELFLSVEDSAKEAAFMGVRYNGCEGVNVL